jgi:hypothetical protein
MGYGSVKTSRNVWIQAVWVLAGGRQRRMHRASSSEEFTVLMLQAEKADLLWQGSLPLFTFSLLFFLSLPDGHIVRRLQPIFLLKTSCAIRTRDGDGCLYSTPKIKKLKIWQFSSVSQDILCYTFFVFYRAWSQWFKNPFINITSRTAITMERALARDWGKVQRFLVYILVTKVHSQVVRALFFF